MEKAFLKLEPTKESIVKVANFISDEMEKCDVPFKTGNKMSIAVDEMYSNVVNYSNATLVEIHFEKEQDKIEVIIQDNGQPFDPTKKEDPDTHSSSQERKIGGLGIFMAKKLMTSLTYTYKENQNCLYMELKI